MSLIPSMLNFKKLVMSIHDPVPHSGEKNTTESMLRSFYFQFPVSKSYLFYSQFAKEQFEQHYKKVTAHKGVIHMKPFTYFNRIADAGKRAPGHILFFGRLSQYKGVDVLLQAMPSVIEEFREEVLVVAGRSISGFELDKNIVQKYSQNITLLNRYICNEELIQLITEAKFIVCPYLDATQSGVLMTAFALNTPVVATSVGAFPEYIREGVTGLLVPPGDHTRLAEKIKQALKNDFYQDMRSNIMRMNMDNQWLVNKDIFLQAYAR
jgi:glycosyltransferase involved in cell wall biosynthesis